MASPEEALAALNNIESYEFEGRTLRLNYAKPKQKKAPPPEKPKPVPAFILFVANLSYEVRAKHLKEFFSSEGANVVSAEVIFHDNPRKSSGYAFVSFKSKKEADAALSVCFPREDVYGKTDSSAT
ncbi:metallophosphoesterase 1-like [Hibiscus syriacus]|uniref:Metallophosphoesterase 1-like n=1 Tax=Hibiscus syriacus TaxID=106335 RepID=A0A6A2Y612_HIBSY|nr:metallophosphoesterase 1-like [Hibiscus syriacus]